MTRWWPLLAGILITPLVVFIGILSGGSGHGDYVLARLLLPWATALTQVANTYRWHGALVILLAFVQCPFYGLLIAWRRDALWPLLVAHLALVVWLFVHGS